MKKNILLLTMTFFLSSCGFKRVDNGNVAIVVDSFSQNVHQKLEDSGLHFDPFTNYLEVDATDVRIQVNDLQPKDKKGMKFQDVDVTVTARLVKDNAVKSYVETKEVVPRDNGSPVLGLGKLEQIVQSATIKAFQEFEYQEFVDDRSVLENAIEKRITQGIQKLMYNAYEVKDVDTKTINLMPAIEKAFQSRSLVAQQLLLIESKRNLMIQELDVQKTEMNKLKEIAQSSGIKLSELLKYNVAKERNQVLGDLSKGGSCTSVLLQVDENKE